MHPKILVDARACAHRTGNVAVLDQVWRAATCRYVPCQFQISGQMSEPLSGELRPSVKKDTRFKEASPSTLEYLCTPPGTEDDRQTSRSASPTGSFRKSHTWSSGSSSSSFGPKRNTTKRTISTGVASEVSVITKNQSATARALQMPQFAEWWMLDPISTTNLSLEKSESFSELGPPMAPAPSWCGKAFSGSHGPRTSCCRRGLFSCMRHLVSKGRLRYEWDGFDLDLSYITTRVIAMSFPAQFPESTYRNPHSQVKRFLDWKHPDHYRIYNLCKEGKRVDNHFPQSGLFPYSDHCPPPFELMVDFCQDVEKYLEANESNVVAIHCKAGKGRTGTMICALLLYAGAYAAAYDALRWYEWHRSSQQSGVTIPAQIRWVAMLQRWKRSNTAGLCSNPRNNGIDCRHRLRSLRLGPLYDNVLIDRQSDRQSDQDVSKHPEVMHVRVGLANRNDVDRHKTTHWYPEVPAKSFDGSYLEVELPNTGPIWTEQDGKLVLHVKRRKKVRRCKRKKILKVMLWWHHSFLMQNNDGLILDISKAFCEGAQCHKDMYRHELTPDSFRVVANFEDLREEGSLSVGQPSNGRNLECSGTEHDHNTEDEYSTTEI